MTQDLPLEQMQTASPSIFDAYDKDLKTTEKVLEQLEGEALDNNHKWESKVLEAAREMVKQKRVNRK